MRWAGLAVVCWTASTLAACERGIGPTSAPPATASTPAALEPALPALSHLSPGLQERLRGQYAALEQARSTSPQESGEAYGAMARLLLAAEMLQAADPFFARAELLAANDARWPYYRGHVARLGNRLGEAEARFERARALQPEYVPTLVWLADVLLAQGRPEAAEPHATRATMLQPGSASAWFVRGRAAMARGNVPAGIEHLERARRLNPRADAISYQLGLAYRRAGDLRRAEPLLQKPADAASVVPSDPLMDTLADLLKGGADFHLARGIEALDARKWPEAVAALRTAADFSPQDAGVRVNLATALFLSGDATAARAAAEAATRLDPKLARAHYLLGLILEAAGRDGEAIDRFSSAIGIDASYTEALASLADALRRTGRVEESLARYQQVLTLDPGASQARFGYGMALVRLERYREAAAWLDEASRLHPDQPGFVHALARVLAAAPDAGVRNGPRAAQLLAPLVKGEPSAAVFETMAMAQAELGRFDDAVTWQRRAIDLVRRAGPAAAARFEENLAAYQRRQPSRMPWRADDPVHRPGAQPG